MPRSGCLILHGVNPNLKQKQKKTPAFCNGQNKKKNCDQIYSIA